MSIKRNVKDLLAAVETPGKLPEDRMEFVWRVLRASYEGIISTAGDNTYWHHTGIRTAHASSKLKGQLDDRKFPLAAIAGAEVKRKSLCKRL